MNTKRARTDKKKGVGASEHQEVPTKLHTERRKVTLREIWEAIIRGKKK